jgi:hypothetical protein
VLPARKAEIGRLGERTLLETILAVDGIPDLLGSITCVSCESFGISDQAHIIALRAGALILGNTVVSFIAFVVVLKHTALAHVLAKEAAERSLGVLALGFLARMLSTRALELAKRVCAPDLGDVFLVVQRFNCTSNVSTHAIFVIPERTLLVEEVYSVV